MLLVINCPMLVDSYHHFVTVLLIINLVLVHQGPDLMVLEELEGLP
jgi:hypothetical protein